MNRIIRPYLYLLVAIVVVILLSFFVEGSLDGYDQRLVVTIGINMILAVSLNLVNGFTGQFSLGHAGFMSVGAYSSAAITTVLLPQFANPDAGGIGQGLFFVGVILAGGIAAALAGLLVGVPSLRLKGDYLAIVTLGFGEIIRVILQNVRPLGGSLGLADIPPYTTFLWVFIILAIVVFIIERLMRSTYGKGFLAVRDDEVAAEAMGVDTTRYKVVAFVVGAFFAGIAGALHAHYNNNLIKPDDFGFMKSVEIVVMVILGGMGSTYGVIFAAAFLTWLPEGMRGFQPFGIPFDKFRMSIYSLMLVILMLVRPQGLFGGIDLKRRKRTPDTRKQSAKPKLEA
jgi:branched-chain amino acid transport system permease protein